MKEELVTKETAVLAKEKGFNWDTTHYYRNEKLITNFDDSGCNESVYYFDADSFYENWNDGRVINDSNNSCWGCTKSSYADVYSAPTQSLLAKWLREVHNIHVTSNYIYTTKIYSGLVRSYNKGYRVNTVGFGKNYTYEQALEEGLKLALNYYVE